MTVKFEKQNFKATLFFKKVYLNLHYRIAAQYIRCAFGLVWAPLNRKYWLSCAILLIRKSHLIRATAVMPSSAAFHNGKPCDVKSESNNDIKMTRIYIISHINHHRHHQFLSIYIIMKINHDHRKSTSSRSHPGYHDCPMLHRHNNVTCYNEEAPWVALTWLSSQTLFNHNDGSLKSPPSSSSSL